MFFTRCSPIASNPNASFFSTSFATLPETATPPGSANLPQAGGYVDPFAKAVVALDDHFAENDADPHLEALILGNGRVALCDAFLQRHGAFDGVHDARELSQQTVAHQLEDMAIVGAQLRAQTVPCGPP